MQPESKAVIYLCLASILGLSAPLMAQSQTPPKRSYTQEQVKYSNQVMAAYNQPTVMLGNLKLTHNIPNNFCLPPYTSNVVEKHFLNTTQGRPGAVESITTKDKAEDVFDWYKNVCKNDGWTFKATKPLEISKLSPKSKLKALYLIEADKPKQHISILCVPDTKRAVTRISISWTK